MKEILMFGLLFTVVLFSGCITPPSNNDYYPTTTIPTTTAPYYPTTTPYYPTTTTTTPSTTTTTIPTYDNEWRIKIFYIYHDTYHSNYYTQIVGTMGEFLQLLYNYDGSTIFTSTEAVYIDYPIDGHDIYFSPSQRVEILQKINANAQNFEEEYKHWEITFFVLDGTSGGAFSTDSESPIWFMYDTFTPNEDYNRAILVAHEFFHVFGCKDLMSCCPGSCCGCIMGDLTISEIHLCSQCYNSFKPENYNKRSYENLMSGG